MDSENITIENVLVEKNKDSALTTRSSKPQNRPSASFTDQIQASIEKFGVGVLLFLLSFVLLVWNERRGVHRLETLQEASHLVTPIDSLRPVDMVRSGQLVHAVGSASNGSVLVDEFFGVTFGHREPLKFKRNMKVLQWVEKKDVTEKRVTGDDGNSSVETVTNYSYTREWVSSLVNSDNFREKEGHKNPTRGELQFDISPIERASNPIHLGSFQLPNGLIKKMDWFEDFPVSSQQLATNITGNVRVGPDGALHLWKNLLEPSVGDVKVFYSVVPSQQVTVVAEQISNSFCPYFTPNGGSVFFVEQGIMSPKMVFRKAMSRERLRAWAVRLLGLVMMYGGIYLIFVEVPSKFLYSYFHIFVSDRVKGIVPMMCSFATSFLWFVTVTCSSNPMRAFVILMIVVGGSAVLHQLDVESEDRIEKMTH